jgi:hypothetical protein
MANQADRDAKVEDVWRRYLTKGELKTNVDSTPFSDSFPGNRAVRIAMLPLEALAASSFDWLMASSRRT